MGDKSLGLFKNAALATLFVVPAVTLQGRTPVSLEEALARTLAAIDSLYGVERRLSTGERAAVTVLMASTEPTSGDAQERENELLRLRGEVSGLESQLDQLHAQRAVNLPGRTRTADGDPLEPGQPAPAVTVGLDDTMRRWLGNGAPAPSNASTPGAAPGASDASKSAAESRPQPEAARKSFEQAGYAADALRLARAYYRQGRFQDGLALLEGRDGTPEETYWRARCLEKLERNPEAIADYERVIASPKAGWEAQRAREDLEFLRWRMDFLSKRGGSAASKAGPNATTSPGPSASAPKGGSRP